MNIVLTGASRGLGYSLAMKFLEDDRNHLLVLSKDIEQHNNFTTAQKQNPRLKLVEFDLARFDDALLTSSVAHFDQVDILINNAGMLINKAFEDISLEEWKSILDVNLLGPVRLVKSLLSPLQQAPVSHIVNIGSMGGFQGSIKFKGLSSYSVSKAALANLTECLAVELAGQKIVANCLCLGAVNTEMFREAFPQFSAPLESAEMADYVYNFSMTGHRYFNGKVLPVSTTTP